VNDPIGEICGTCGSDSVLREEIEHKICPICRSTNIEDPEVLVANIASDFFTTIQRVYEVNAEFTDLYRSFDFMVALVRFCRFAGLMGLPQMEMQLDKVSTALKKINNQAIESLNSIRREGLYDVRSHKYFKDVKLEHYRSLDGVLRNTDEKVIRHLDQIRFWVSEVKHRIELLKPTALFLRQHYEMFEEISPHLPEGVNDVVAIIPPLSMSIRTKKRKEQDDCYIIFTAEFAVFLPRRAVTHPDKAVNGIKVSYANFFRRERKVSMVKGVQLEIKLLDGSIIMNAPPQVLDTVENYFGLVDADEPYMVGSPKKIVSIEAMASDKNEYKRAATKLVTIFNEWLFEERVQTPQAAPKVEMPSITDLKNQLDKLERHYRDINYQARHREIPMDRFQNETSMIKDRYASIKDTLAKLSGHFGGLDHDNLDDEFRL
jgi:hypothetical protein